MVIGLHTAASTASNSIARRSSGVQSLWGVSEKRYPWWMSSRSLVRRCLQFDFRRVRLSSSDRGLHFIDDPTKPLFMKDRYQSSVDFVCLFIRQIAAPPNHYVLLGDPNGRLGRIGIGIERIEKTRRRTDIRRCAGIVSRQPVTRNQPSVQSDCQAAIASHCGRRRARSRRRTRSHWCCAASSRGPPLRPPVASRGWLRMREFPARAHPRRRKTLPTRHTGGPRATRLSFGPRQRCPS